MGNASTRAFNAHDLPSVGAAADFPVKSTWLAAIKAASWPGLTYANASKYCPSRDETIIKAISPKYAKAFVQPSPRPCPL
jgi:hypothetical protein